MGAFSVFLLGTFVVGDAATQPQAVVEVRLTTAMQEPGLLSASDACAIAGELAAQLRPDPTIPAVSDGEFDARLALLKQAQITFDQSESAGPLVRIQWQGALASNIETAAELANAGHAFAQAVTQQARESAAASHLASGELLDDTTDAIYRLERSLEELIESKLSADDTVLPVSYQTLMPPTTTVHSGPRIRPANAHQQPPGLLINDFAGELESIQDAERLREMKMRLIGERAQLLQDKTERHPDVTRKDAQIEYVQQKLDSLPVTPLNGRGNGPHLQDVSASTSVGEPVNSQRLEQLIAKLKFMQQGRESLFSEWRSRMITLNQLRQERDQLLRAERLALANRVNLAEAEVATVEDVRLSREIVPRRWAIIAGFLVFGSVIAGGSLASWGKRCAATFASISDVRKTAGIPVMGTIVSAETDALPRAARSRKLFRLAIFACEMFLLVTVLWIAILAIADLEYRALLIDNPLAALLETCSRSWNLLLG